MRVSIFGMGYVGTVSAACLAARGHEVVGVDPNEGKVQALGAGRSPVVEPGLDRLVQEGVASGRLRATTDPAVALADSDLSLIAVGTPAGAGGRVDLDPLQRCLGQIGAALRDRDTLRVVPNRHVVVVRSTVPPGTMAGPVQGWLVAAAGRPLGDRLGLCFNPEFLREGQALADYQRPVRTVIAASDDASFEAAARLHAGIDAPLFRTDFATAELIKYTDNAWHALKVAFANEIGSLAKAHAIDGRDLMAIFRRDDRLNLSGAYLRPGFAFGGSCLPKDLRALTRTAQDLDLSLPVLNSVLASNQAHLERVLARIIAHPVRKIGIFGIAFKAATDDLRESPMVELVERLLGKGYDVRVYDPVVQPATLQGANRAFTLAHLPHIAKLLSPTPDTVIDHAELLLIGHVDPAVAPLIATKAATRPIIDCIGLDQLRALPGYQGLCW